MAEIVGSYLYNNYSELDGLYRKYIVVTGNNIGIYTKDEMERITNKKIDELCDISKINDYTLGYVYNCFREDDKYFDSKSTINIMYTLCTNRVLTIKVMKNISYEVRNKTSKLKDISKDNKNNEIIRENEEYIFTAYGLVKYKYEENDNIRLICKCDISKKLNLEDKDSIKAVVVYIDKLKRCICVTENQFKIIFNKELDFNSLVDISDKLNSNSEIKIGNEMLDIVNGKLKEIKEEKSEKEENSKKEENKYDLNNTDVKDLESKKELNEDINKSDNTVDEEVLDIKDINIIKVNNEDTNDIKETKEDKKSQKIIRCVCNKCHNTGKYIGEDGIWYTCGCKMTQRDEERREKRELFVNQATKLNIVADGIIHPDRIDDEFSIEIGIENLKESVDNSNYVVRNYRTFGEQANAIIAACKTDGLKIDGSYLIGADNGFGKTTFVNTCLKSLYRRDKKVVPYITLYELAKLRAKAESEIRETIAYGYVKKHEEDTVIREEEYYEVVAKKFKWDDYLDADVLFVCLGTKQSIRLETEILDEILRIRGMRRLPTIVTTEKPLSYYTQDSQLSEYIWSNIVCSPKEGKKYDKLTHISSYKRVRTKADVRVGSNI